MCDHNSSALQFSIPVYACILVLVHDALILSRSNMKGKCSCFVFGKDGNAIIQQYHFISNIKIQCKHYSLDNKQTFFVKTTLEKKPNNANCVAIKDLLISSDIMSSVIYLKYLGHDLSICMERAYRVCNDYCKYLFILAVIYLYHSHNKLSICVR